ncbi:NUDIX domain-containing protein [Amycolatopsis sp. NPDC059090]|uniref:NUDIX domain-containing protein n=1 Tax=unclassified Amycolatopsis TaxID=2618356 RepID=UPI00367229F1
MELLPFDEYVRSLPRKRMSAGTLLRDETGRVLLVEPSYKDSWDIPGGVCDAGEAPWRTARREQAEEIGIDRPLGPLLVIDYAPDDGRMPEGLAFIFDGGRISAEEAACLTLTDPEILAVHLLPIDEAAQRVAPPLARRLRVSWEAARTGERFVLCEDGRPLTAPVTGTAAIED